MNLRKAANENQSNIQQHSYGAPRSIEVLDIFVAHPGGWPSPCSNKANDAHLPNLLRYLAYLNLDDLPNWQHRSSTDDCRWACLSHFAVA